MNPDLPAQPSQDEDPRSERSSPRSTDLGRWLSLGVAAVSVVYGVSQAVAARWLCDDAFISFRYARNLVEGNGLVFNPGERVEGFTNFLWTLWCAAGMEAGFTPQFWSQFWGVVAYGATIVLLWGNFACTRRLVGAEAGVAPLAVLLAAFHRDWHIYATSGLETSTVTLLSFAGYVLLVHGATRRRQLSLAAGAIMALAVLTRPDAVLFAFLGGVYLLFRAVPRISRAAEYAVAFSLVFGPPTLWRIWYYGDLLPNTFYAKSGDLSWWQQGRHYLSLYLEQYWILGVGVGAAAVLLAAQPLLRRRLDSRWRQFWSSGVLALAMVLLYGAYVVRVGGDFMYARMFIPIAPFCVVLAEHALFHLRLRHRVAPWVVSVLLLLGLVAPAPPLDGMDTRHGVADEWQYYQRLDPGTTAREDAEVLRRFLSDVPVRVVFLGSEARTVYEARIPYAIEAETGLTDYEIARQTLTERGRVGHEKNAPLPYLIRKRGAHLTFHPAAVGILGIHDHIPLVEVRLGHVSGWILHWDPHLLGILRQRGARFMDFPSRLDEVLAELETAPRERVEAIYLACRLFYFDHVDDPERHDRFLRLLDWPQRNTGP